MRLAIHHTTRYALPEPATYGLQRLRLTPKPTHGQKVVVWDMSLAGARREVEYEDEHCNVTTLVSIEPGTREVVITCEGVVETVERNGILGPHSGHMPLWAFLAQTPLTQPGPNLRALLVPLRENGAEPLDRLHALSDAIVSAIAYEPGTTTVTTTAEQALTAGRGVCQDHAQVFIGAARALGLPARYVSGYLMMDDHAEQQASHAWAEAYVTGLGWVGFDVSNEICPDGRYVRVATGCDYRQAAPVTGFLEGGSGGELSVSVAVEQRASEQ